MIIVHISREICPTLVCSGYITIFGDWEHRGPKVEITKMWSFLNWQNIGKGNALLLRGTRCERTRQLYLNSKNCDPHLDVSC